MSSNLRVIMILCVLTCMSITMPMTAFAGKVDQFYKVVRNNNVSATSLSKSNAVSEVMIDVFIKTNDIQKTSKRIVDVGGTIRSVVGQIIVARLPGSHIEDPEGWDEVVYVEASKPLMKKNNQAQYDTGVSRVRMGEELNVTYDGTDVIVGIIDSGIDYDHPDFYSERIMYIWDQDNGDFIGRKDFDSVDPKDLEGHGTHVAGIAAGADGDYDGVAKNANIIAVKPRSFYTVDEFLGNAFSADVCEGAKFIFDRAYLHGMPAVINISMGTSIGPHDGTTLFEECLNELVNEREGRAIVVSAGNGSKDVGGTHVNFPVHSWQDMAVGVYGGANQNFLYIDIWEEEFCNTDIMLRARDPDDGVVDSSSWVGKGEVEEGSLAGGGMPIVYYNIVRSTEPNPLNGKYHSYIAMYPSAPLDITDDFFDVVASGGCTRLDAWTFPGDYFYFGNDEGFIDSLYYEPGNNESTVESPSTAENVISVGAYVTRTSWTNMHDIIFYDASGLINDTGELAYYSARGPLVEPKYHKPDITAPGTFIISTMSGDASVNSAYRVDTLNHMVMSGTSMASPHVAGVVALMLNAYPGLTYNQITNYLKSTAREDDFVTALSPAPNFDWGYGKVDAYAAVKAVEEMYGGQPYEHEQKNNQLVVDGISHGDNDISPQLEKIEVTYKRGLLDSLKSCDWCYYNLKLNEITDDSVDLSSSMAAWDRSLCFDEPWYVDVKWNTYYDVRSDDDGDTIILSGGNGEVLGEGRYALCIGAEEDAYGIKYDSKSITFTTSGYMPGAGDNEGNSDTNDTYNTDSSGGGCELIGDDSSSQHGIVFAMAILLLSVFINWRAREKLERKSYTMK
jgi:minor extracellular serine protease Vpr